MHPPVAAEDFRQYILLRDAGFGFCRKAAVARHDGNFYRQGKWQEKKYGNVWFGLF